MRRSIGVAVLMLAATVGWAAAPPGQPRNLTAEEAKEVAALDARRGRHFNAGEFEQGAKVAAQISSYRKQRQGAAHWQAIEARFTADDWRRLAAVPGKDRSEVVRAITLSSQGKALLAQGRFGEAEPPLRQVLAITQKVLGENHPFTASSYTNVASCLDDLGKSSEALPLYRQALAIRRKALGENHPSTATSYNNVANCLHDLGKSSEALPLFRQALAIRRKVLGQNHPSTA